VCKTSIDKLPVGVCESDVQSVLAGSEISWRYAIITQILGKAVDIRLDVLSLQEKDDSQGSWDAREFAKRVVVPWNDSLGGPLGSSKDPYVSNIFRHPRFGDEMRRDRRSPEQYDRTFRIVSAAAACGSSAEVRVLLREVLSGLRRWLQGKNPEYPIPLRASLKSTLDALSQFLQDRSGGSRLQAIIFALFKAVGETRGFYDSVRSSHVNAADAARERAGDVECFRDGVNAITVEVKDSPIDREMVDASARKARLSEITELIIVSSSERPLKDSEQGGVEVMIAREFSSGLNIYCASAMSILTACLSILGEEGRRVFLGGVGECLSEQNADYAHRIEWARIVRTL
jgi:hypothetical protein